ncbi:MFS transporter [Nonomuraea sp. NPDC050310]|uniref:MFS transporter n=1 Tax=Nonomuraea sp. NPDC050310 TaxID=3154935 RepID=UPI0033C4F9DB
MRTRPAGAWALPVICVAQLILVLDVTIVNVALPSIQQGLGFDPADLAWVTTAYTLPYGGLLLLGGRLGDLLGRRRTFLAGVAVFTLASLLGGLVDEPGPLIAARALQGVGAALTSPSALSLLHSAYPEGPARHRALAVYGALSGVGVALGLLSGGLLTEFLSWRWVMLVNVPIGLLVLVLAPLCVPVPARSPRRLDLPGVLLGTAGLVTLAYGLSRPAEHGWDDGPTLVVLAAAAGLLAVFVLVERQVERLGGEPAMPLALWRHRTRAGAYLIAGLFFACLYPAFFFLTRFIQDVLGYGALEAGWAAMPIGVGTLVIGLVARRLVTRVPLAVLVAAGGAFAALAGLWLGRLEPDSGYWAALFPAMVGLSVGVGFALVANTLSAMTEVAERDAGLASGVLGTAQQIGGSLGLAAFASLAATRSKDEFGEWVAAHPRTEPGTAVLDEALTSGFSLGFVLTAGAAGLALVVALLTAARRVPPVARPVAVPEDALATVVFRRVEWDARRQVPRPAPPQPFPPQPVPPQPAYPQQQAVPPPYPMRQAWPPPERRS